MNLGKKEQRNDRDLAVGRGEGCGACDDAAPFPAGSGAFHQAEVRGEEAALTMVSATAASTSPWV